MKEVNNFKYKALFIETTDFIVNIGNTTSSRKLLPSSAYKKNYAKANGTLNTQLSFNIFDNNNINITESKKYAEIIYGYKLGNLTHLNIILPNAEYNKIEYSVNILDNAQIYNNYIPKEQVEESIVSLKKSLLKESENIG